MKKSKFRVVFKKTDKRQTFRALNSEKPFQLLRRVGQVDWKECPKIDRCDVACFLEQNVKTMKTAIVTIEFK